MPAIRTKAVGLFTTDEDAILARWFGVEPPDSAKAIDVAEAIQRLGFADEPDHYSYLAAAVAFNVLERVEEGAPQVVGLLRGQRLHCGTLRSSDLYRVAFFALKATMVSDSELHG